jgi:hypothetical protein
LGAGVVFVLALIAVIGSVRSGDGDPDQAGPPPGGVVGEDDDEAVLSAQVGAPDAGGNTPLVIHATDGAPVGSLRPTGSGVQRVEVLVGGELVKTYEQPCPGGGCPFDQTYVLSPERSPATNEITVIAYDGAGNSATETAGLARTFEYFGYNENWTVNGPQKLAWSASGGSNLVRVFINWCTIADVIPGTEAAQLEGHPENWRWAEYGLHPSVAGASGFMTDIARWNIGHPNQRLSVVLGLVDSPRWADAGSNGCGTPHSAPPSSNPVSPPDDAHVDDWGEFVDGVLERWGPPHEDVDTPGAQTVGSSDFGVVAIEVWNEPNSPEFWGSASEVDDWDPPTNWRTRFAELVVEADAQVTQERLQAAIQVVTGGLSPTGKPVGPYLGEALPMMAGAPDAIGAHLYANRATRDGNGADSAAARLGEQYDELIRARDGAGLQSRPVWVTEIGFPSNPWAPQVNRPNVSAESQRRRLIEAYARYTARAEVAAFIVHRLQDPGREEDGALREPENYGVIADDAVFKPAYCELAARRSAVPAGC